MIRHQLSITGFLTIDQANRVAPRAPLNTETVGSDRKTALKSALFALVAVTLLALAPFSKAETPNSFTRHGLPVPGAYFPKPAGNKPVATHSGIFVRLDQ